MLWGLPFSELKDAFDLLVFAIGLIFTVVMWRMKGTFVSKAAFIAFRTTHEATHDQITARLNAGEKKFADIRRTLETLATAEQVSELRIDVTKVEGELATLDQKIDGHHEVNLRTEKLLNTIHQYLLNGSKG